MVFPVIVEFDSGLNSRYLNNELGGFMSAPKRKKLPHSVNFTIAMLSPGFVAFMRTRMRQWVTEATADQLSVFRIVRVVDFYLCTPSRIDQPPLTLMAKLELQTFAEERREEIPQPLVFDSVMRGLLELPMWGSAYDVSANRPHLVDIEAFNRECGRYARLFN